MNKYFVISPKLKEIEPILDDGSGPSFYYQCCTYIKAPNKRKAIHEAIKTKEFRPWVEYQKYDNCCPFSGVHALLIKHCVICNTEFMEGEVCDCCKEEV